MESLEQDAADLMTRPTDTNNIREMMGMIGTHMTKYPLLLDAVQKWADKDGWVVSSASKSSIRRFVITEKAPTRAFSWLKAAPTAFTFKTLLRHYAKQALTPLSLNMKLGPRRNYHEGRAAIRHYANQPTCPL